jgi:signal transduction histidine kinase
VTLSAPGPAVGQWDRLRLEQVVTNLLSNAIKYGEGKPVEVEVAGDAVAVTLRVRDHGIGIAPEDRRRIFERFERAVSADHYGGFGLGLWICRQVVEVFEGTIDVASAPGQGSTFVVTLPRSTGAARPS